MSIVLLRGETMQYQEVEQMIKNENMKIVDYIDTLTNEQRKQLRDELLKDGYKHLPRNLFYNYKTQEWID